MKVRIENRRFVFKPLGDVDWSKTHAQVPFAFRKDDGSVRVYFSTRDNISHSSVGYVDLSISDKITILNSANRPCLTRGERGYFDDSGTMPSWFLKHKDKIRLYYTAWNRSVEASYRLSIGIAESSDNGETFQKMYNGPILDRGKFDPIWVGQPCVILENKTWKMWYLSCQKIEMIEQIPEPFYNVKYAESNNGIDWVKKEITCIDFDSNTDAIGRPCVWKHKDKYLMLHSNRKAIGYRNNKDAGYRIELSLSKDGLSWSLVSEFAFPKSEEGWDSIMCEYCSIIPNGENKYLMFYNGNGFGESGFGVCDLIVE